MHGALLCGLVIVVFGAGLGVGCRWRQRLRDLIDYLGEAVTSYRMANHQLVDANNQLHAELTRISGEHPAIGSDDPRWGLDEVSF